MNSFGQLANVTIIPLKSVLDFTVRQKGKKLIVQSGQGSYGELHFLYRGVGLIRTVEIAKKSYDLKPARTN